MSSTPPTTTTQAPATTTSDTFFTSDPSAPSKGGGTNSSSLYLFTFLAALFLLLFVSSAIILRSFVLRRRFRRRIEEAILAGVITPNEVAHGRGRRRNFGEKPKIWEAHVVPGGGDEWSSIMPVAVLASATAPPQDSSPDAQYDTDSTDSSRPPLYGRVFRNPFRTRPRPPSPSASTPTHAEAAPAEAAVDVVPDSMQVSVLIAMPDARRSHMMGAPGASSTSWKGKTKSVNSNWEYEDDELPEMVIGVAELPYRQGGGS